MAIFIENNDSLREFFGTMVFIQFWEAEFTTGHEKLEN